MPAAEIMVDSENSAAQEHPNEFCLNCGTKLVDRYCHHCGQRDIPRRQTLSELFTNFISSFWSYEGKFFLTTKYIFTRPGFLATEYNKGKRESYFHPARMYVFVSFLFFLLFVSLPDANNDAVDVGLSEDDKEQLAKIGLDSSFKPLDSVPGVRLDTIVSKAKKSGNVNWNLNSTKYKSIEEYDSIQATLPEKERDGWMSRLFERRTIELNKKYKGDMGQFAEDFASAFGDNFSKVLFYLMPFFALILKLLYIRRDFYYSEHLVFTIYYYNFFYVAGSVVMLLNLVPALGAVAVLLSIWIYFYLMVAMKKTYGQSWRKTIVKFFLFTFIFSFFLICGVAINVLAIVLSI